MEPTPEEAAEGSILVKILAAVLERLVNSNTTIARSDPGHVTKFHALKPPGINVEAYLERVQKYASCSNECFILALIYIDRLIERNNFLLTDLNVHRVVITAILLAAKFFDDAYYNNAYYAKVGGVLVSELNGLEVDFLFRINFSLHVSPEVFEKYKAELVAHSMNSGLIAAANFLTSSSSMPSQLTNIPEVEPGQAHAGSNCLVTGSPELARRQLHQPTQQQYTFPTDVMHTSGNHASISAQVSETSSFSQDAVMTAPKQVTPSPSLASEVIASMVNGNVSVGPIPNSSSNNSILIQAQAQHMDQLNASTASIIPASFQPLQPSKPYLQQQQQQSIVLQRTTSLPYFSSERCIGHAFKLPYSAPPMQAALPNVLAAIDQEHYQMMMNQLFPIENTLVHHNHEVAGTASSNISNHQLHVNAAAGIVGHHHSHVAGASSHPRWYAGNGAWSNGVPS